MRKFLDILTEAPALEAERLEAFDRLADAQRGAPEMAMLRAQDAIGGGVMSVMVEHIGDLTHRMAEKSDFIPHAGYEFVKPKVERGLRHLKDGYGFSREHYENITNNARYHNVPVEEYSNKVRTALRAYADAHKKLRVYNYAQELARDAAVALGEEKFGFCQTCLDQLMDMLETPEKWAAKASAYDPDYRSN
jgi:hypothetical protein